MAKVPLTVDHIRTGKYVINVESVGLTQEQFFRLCSDNPELRLELTARKEIIVMSSTNSRTGMRNAEINRQLGNWAKQDGRGVFFDSNTGFVLPNGANRSPHASWILRPRWEPLTPQQQSLFAPICPDFVIELWSPSDILNEIPVQAGRICRKWRETRIFDLSATTEHLRLSSRPRSATSGQSSIRAG